MKTKQGNKSMLAPRKLPCDLMSSTPPNFFLKITAIPFPILASALMQWARDSFSEQENKSPRFSHNFCVTLVPWNKSVEERSQ